MKFIRVLKASDETAKAHLRWLIYQVHNGGVEQYCFNGYADDFLQYVKQKGGIDNVIMELKDLNCPEDGTDAIRMMYSGLTEHTPSYECPDCNGSGELENEDENGDITTEWCDRCSGEGYIESNKWSDTHSQPWMEEYENWLYALNTKELDDWTNQSHNHSVFMDMMKQNKKGK